MPRVIAKIENAYFEWSTVVDAPVSEAMSRDEFVTYMVDGQGADPAELSERMARADANGTSYLSPMSAEELLVCNRAGKGESELTFADFVDGFIPANLRTTQPG